MVEPAHLGQFDDFAVRRQLDWPRPWRVLAETQMGSRSVVVIEVLAEDAVEMPRVEHNKVIETLSPYGADEALDVRVLPG